MTSLSTRSRHVAWMVCLLPGLQINTSTGGSLPSDDTEKQGETGCDCSVTVKLMRSTQQGDDWH